MADRNKETLSPKDRSPWMIYLICWLGLVVWLCLMIYKENITG